MLVVGLIHDPDWRPPEEPPAEHRPHRPVPWRGIGWTAAIGGLLGAVPVVEDELGGAAGYGVLLAAITLGAWRLDRWAGRQYWRGLGEHRE